MRGREFRMKDMYSFHVDQADFGVLLRFFQLLEQLFDRLQFLLQLQGQRNSEFFPAGKIPAGCHLLDLVDGAELVDERHQLRAEAALVVFLGIPEAFEQPELFLLHSLLEGLPVFCRWLGLLGRVPEGFAGLGAHGIGFIAFEDQPPPLLECLDQRRKRRSQPLDLLGIEHDRLGQLFLGELIDVAKGQQMLHGGADHVGDGRAGGRNAGRIVLLVGMDNSAERIAVGHGVT